MKDNKILLCVGCNCGGAERMTILYGKILQKAGFNITLLVYLPIPQSEYPLKPFIPENWDVKYINGKFRTYAYKMLKSIKELKPDIVFSSMSYFAQYAILFRKLHLIKSQVIVRENTSPTRNSMMQCRLSNLLYPNATAVIAQTKEMKDEMMKYYKMDDSEIIVINNPLDVDQIEYKSREQYPFDHNYINYVAVGRLSTPKDYPTLLKAFVLAHKSKPLSRLYIVGAFENHKIKEELDCIISNNNLSDSVFFEGFQENPYQYMKWCDVFCLSSSIEGLPNVLLEALYLGRPVASTRCIPFVSQIIDEGKNGYTCPIKDPSALAQSMAKAAKLIGNDISYISKTEQDIVNVFNSH